MADEKFIQEVTRWLEQSGYPLEMLVAREFRRAKFPTWQSAVYEDVSSGQQREIDVVATRAAHLDKWTVRLQFVIECKRSPEAAWIVFAGEEGSRPTRPNLFFTVANREAELLRAAFTADEEIRRLPLFTAFFGVQVTELCRHSENQRRIFATRQSCKHLAQRFRWWR